MEIFHKLLDKKLIWKQGSFYINGIKEFNTKIIL